MIELLAPAGDFERLKFAFLYGADAVYFGGQNYSLRANAKNFDLDDIKKATEYAHSLNKKVYVTVNIVFHNENLEGLKDYLLYLESVNVDGIIASDIVVLKMIKDLNSLCASNKTIYIRETLSFLETRLTLKDFFSENLEADYNAIYRTDDEFLDFIKGIDGNITIETGEIFDELKNKVLGGNE